MKVKTSFLILFNVLLFNIIYTLYPPNSFAENYAQMGLPNGAKTRIGKGEISDLLYSPNGDILAVVSSIGIWLYDTKYYQEISLLPIPKNRNRALAHRIQNTRFTVDGQTLISDTEEKLAILWDITTRESKVISLVNQASFSSDRQTLTIETENKTIDLWKGNKEIIEKSEKEYGEIDIIIVYSHDGKTSATAVDEYNIRIKDTQAQKLTKFHIKFPKFNYGQEIYLSPNGKTLATLNLDAPIRLWDVNIGRLKKTFVGHLVKKSHRPINTRYLLPAQVDSVTFSPDGNKLANGSSEGTILIWNTNSGKFIRKLTGQFGFIKSLSFSSDGKLLASGSDDGSILIWDTETEKHEFFLAERMNSISCVSFSRDDRMLIGGSVNGDIFLFDVEEGKHIKTFIGHIAEISHLMFSPDDNQLASAGWDGSVRLWDIETGKLVKTLSVPISIHFRGYWEEILFTQDGNLIAINSEFDFMHLWNVNTGEYERMLMGHASHLRSFSMSSDEQALASFSADGTVLVWDLSSITNFID